MGTIIKVICKLTKDDHDPFATTEWTTRSSKINNTMPLPARVYANEGIAQLVFLKADIVCEKSYADKAGKYQDQEGLTLPKVD